MHCDIIKAMLNFISNHETAPRIWKQYCGQMIAPQLPATALAEHMATYSSTMPIQDYLLYTYVGFDELLFLAQVLKILL